MKKKLALSVYCIMLIATYAVAQHSDTTNKTEKPQHDPPITRPLNAQIGEAGNNYGFDMAPETTPRVVMAAVRTVKSNPPKGPFQPTWESLKANYKVPDWFKGIKFGICMHLGLYSVPAYKNEWYEKFMYELPETINWHTKNFGPPEKFGYKDFIPKFTLEHFNADEWVTLFKKAGARYFVPACQHHENFALWDSEVTPFNSMKMGPHRDVMGEFAKAARKQGLKFGFTNHGIENFQFINPTAELSDSLRRAKADLFDPKWEGFYYYADRSDEACRKFLVDWYERNVELINKYQPDILWFDNGIDQRYLDPIKLQLAAYYYNTAKKWGKEVTISSKKAAFAPSGVNTATIGSVLNFEAAAPPGIRTGVWNLDAPIATSWGYTEDMRMHSAASIIERMIDIVSKNGNMLLNVSPKADGTLPQVQVATLLSIGNWMDVNSEAIYDTHNWIKFSEKDSSGSNINFTVKGNVLYAIIQKKYPSGEIFIKSLPASIGKIRQVTMLGSNKKLQFVQDSKGLRVNVPSKPPCEIAWTLKITGLKMNSETSTPDGNPVEYQQNGQH
ncbi:MAG TPA: alpha-L-fucosidase [Segetibacter sp.]